MHCIAPFYKYMHNEIYGIYIQRSATPHCRQYNMRKVYNLYEWLCGSIVKCSYQVIKIICASFRFHGRAHKLALLSANNLQSKKKIHTARVHSTHRLWAIIFHISIFVNNQIQTLKPLYMYITYQWFSLVISLLLLDKIKKKCF